VWELLNETQNSGLHAAAAHEGALDDQLKSTQQQAEAIRAQIATTVQEYTNMDNDGNGANDGLIAGKIALAESLKADLANVQSRVDELQAKTIDAASTTAVTDGERHVLLQLADEQPQPARWLIMWASCVFLIPEFTLALLAWSMHGGGRREEKDSHASEGHNNGLVPAHLAQQHAQWLIQQQHLHAMHSMSHAFPVVNARAGQAPGSHQNGEQVSEWGGSMVHPSGGTHLAIAGRSSSTTSTTQTSTQGPAHNGYSPLSVPGAPLAPVESINGHSQQPSASPLAIVGAHPGLIHHAQPDGMTASASQSESSPSERSDIDEASPTNATISNLREAKRRKHNLFGSSATKAHKQKGRKARNLSELAARLN